jgi:HAD superfamily hydrolase (TIGR01484 family)
VSRRILICTDLDRTLLPNGPQPESPRARERFAQLIRRPEVTLAYATGRHLDLVLEAIATYEIPLPDYLIGDAGASIYTVDEENWVPWKSWSAELERDWPGAARRVIEQLFQQIDGLRLQEPDKQSRFKIGYCADPDLDIEPMLETMQDCLVEHNVPANLTWSVNETIPIGLLDVLPARATKRHAVEFLMGQMGFTRTRIVFAGDSGNDLPALTSMLPAVLVANATPEVREQALRLSRENGTLGDLYLAQGGFQGMNGNYGAGILEGVAHFLPETVSWWN